MLFGTCRNLAWICSVVKHVSRSCQAAGYHDEEDDVTNLSSEVPALEERTRFRARTGSAQVSGTAPQASMFYTIAGS